MHKQLELDLNNIDESKKSFEIHEWLQKIVNQTVPLTDSIILGDFLTCPNCEANYIELNWCECWYWVELKEEIDIDETDFIEKTLKKASWEKLPIFPETRFFNKRKQRYFIIKSKEFFIDTKNSSFSSREAEIYLKNDKERLKIKCSFETFSQQDENHRIERDSTKIIHNLKIETFSKTKTDEEWASFNYEEEYKRKIKTFLTINVLNRPKYNKNL